ncbi:MAG: hypothetical protein M9962_06555 [Oligoflexia bacterium]|nr:hypothetical protein [Oligoflexia bacterium]
MKIIFISFFILLYSALGEANAFVEPPKNLRQQEFSLEKERNSEDDNWKSSIEEGIEVVRSSAAYSTTLAIKELKWLVDRKSVAYEIRAEAMTQLRRRIERLTKRKFRQQERYLQKKIRDKNDRPEVLSPAYDALAAMQRKEGFAWSTIKSSSVNPFIRVRAAEDYLTFNPSVGKKREIVRLLEKVKISSENKELYQEQLEQLRSDYGLN